jgi:8-oxo-dGTP pyrophosphatase MutT (NUDIX family)
METFISEVLQSRKSQELTVPGRRLAAVLVPLYRDNGDYGVIFTKRSERMSKHRGQIAFPGGGHEPQDRSLEHTALRESSEEIGLQPDHVRVLGQLDDLLTNNSNYLVRPYVGVIPYPYDFILDHRETDYIIEVPLNFLRENNPVSQVVREHEGRVVQSFFFDYNEHIIWGATAKIIKQFLDLLDQAEL